MWATVLSLGTWLLYKTQESIAQLTQKSHEQEYVHSDWDFSFGTSCVTILMLDSIGWSWAAAAVLLPNFWLLGQVFYQRQLEFASADLARKSESPTYICSTDPATRSGWANSPTLLSRLPPWITTRRLTCMTLIEVGLLIVTVFLRPDWGGGAIALAMLAHYVTDALDGAVGRHRGEGYVQWGYYADHCFDALYELICVAMLDQLIGPSYGLGSLLFLGMATSVWLFHERELINFATKQSMCYSNLMAGVPLHYGEWAAIACALSVQLLGISWYVIASLLCCSLGVTLHWLISFHWRQEPSVLSVAF